MSQSWEALVSVALLGTDRQKTLPAIAEKNLKTLLNQVNAEDAADWLLSAAGTLAAYQQAGQKPEQRTGPLTEPASAETSALAESDDFPYLRMIFTQDFQPALPEFLTLLQQVGQCIPPEHLPQLLDWGHFHPEVRLPLRSVIGPRGEWLARLNPKWRYAQATPQASNPEEWKALWEKSDRTVRLNLLRKWRLQDPTAARELLAATWKQDSAKDRAAFLGCLSVGLSLADETFLEVGLADRSKDVRASAIELLTRLPDSQFSQELAIKASSLIQYTTIEGNLQVEVTLPQADDLQWKNYEFKAQYPSRLVSKQGDRANLLIQILEISPLSIWEKLGSPEQLIHEIANHGWELPLIQGWSLACQRQQNLVWAHTLLRWFGQNSSFQLHEMGAVEIVAQLLSILPIETRCQWVTAWLESQEWNEGTLHLLSNTSSNILNPSSYLEILKLLLNTIPVPWSLELSKILLSSTQIYLKACNAQNNHALSQIKWVAAHHLKSLAYSLHPSSLNTLEISQLRLLYADHLETEFEQVLEILRFRQQMHQALFNKKELSG